jgi:uncharacterized protein YbgA (DUF1722 family)/uncharacterized protein YbbK (DUF523 family)
MAKKFQNNRGDFLKPITHNPLPMTSSAGIKIGISACLLGEKVRYDGGHKLDPFLTDTLGRYVDFVPVCPEAELGLGVPREAMRLVGDPDHPRLVTIKTGQDISARMNAWARKRVVELEEEDLSGFIFKSRSPSSGMERVKVYSESGPPVKGGVGFFARIFMEHFPLLPVEEEGRLHDPVLRENFVERVFELRRWRECLSRGKTIRNLVEFHTVHKLTLLSHSVAHYRLLGKLVAAAEKLSREELYMNYQSLFLEAIALKATPRKHTNVLHHMMGYFKKQLSPDEKKELLEIIDHYRLDIYPLIVPMTLMNHYIRKYDQPYLMSQVYLNPHPVELQLRNHV